MTTVTSLRVSVCKNEKKGRKRKFKDVNDILENATDEQFSVIHRNLEEHDLKLAGWLLFKRLELKGYAPL
jgi:hypothetical protein